MASTCSILENDPCGFEKTVCSAAPWFILDLCKLGQNCVSVNCIFQKFYILSNFWFACAISNKRLCSNFLCLWIWQCLLPILLYSFFFEARKLHTNKLKIVISSCSTDPIIIMKYLSWSCIVLLPLKATLLDSACKLSYSVVLTLCDPMMIACQAPLSMGFSRQEYWDWVAMPSSRGSSQPRDWTSISCIPFIAGGLFTSEPPGKPGRY